MKSYKGSYLSCFLMYFFYFASLAFFSGYISVYLMDRGFSAVDVSMVVSCSYIVSMLVQPVVGWCNDRFEMKKLNCMILLGSALLGILFIFMKNIVTVALMYSLALSLFNATNPVVEQMATQSKFAYGKIRIWGTVGYAAASKVSGLVYTHIAPSAMYVFFAIGTVLCVLGIYGTSGKAKPKAKNTAGKEGMFDSVFLIYLVLIVIFYGTTNISSTYFPAMFKDKGMNMDTISTIVFLLTLSELPIVFFSGRFMNTLSNKQLLTAVFALLTVQFSVYAFVQNQLFLVITAILTKAVATMSFIMINLKVVNTIVSPSKVMSGFAVVQMAKSFSSICCQYLAGNVIDSYSYSVLYMILAVFAVTGLAICFFYKIPSGNDQKLFG